MNTKWDKRFMEVAQLVATWSKDPSTKVGAVIADDRKIVISVGYNGFPMGTDDSPLLYADRSRKYPRIIHAERNAILFAQAKVGSIMGMSLYVTMPPCGPCAGIIIQAGIKRVVVLEHKFNNPKKWAAESLEAQMMFQEAGVQLFTLKEHEEKVSLKEIQLDLFEDQEAM